MARRTTHPEGLKEVHALEITTEISSFVTTLANDIKQERTNRSQWEIKLDRYRDLRYGYRKPKFTPWKNCANYSIPLIDAHINRMKPSYINLQYGISPICTFEPFGSEDVEPGKKRELLFDWRMRTKVDFFNDYCIGTDKELEQGSVVYKIAWEYTTKSYTKELDLEDFDEKTLAGLYDENVTDEMLMKIVAEELAIDMDFEENLKEVTKTVEKFREGKTTFTLDLLEVEHDRPKITACSVRDDIVVPVDTTDIQYARFIDQPFWRTTNELKVAMRDEKYVEYDDNTIKSWGQHSSTDKKAKSELSGDQDDIILLHEDCVWYDIDDDGIKERCICTWPDNKPADVLRFIEVPYDHGLFPYVQIRRELNDPGFYTPRGVPALDEDYQVGISSAVNQAEDNGTIVNRPVVVMRRNTVTNIKSRSYVPGETVETNTHPDNYQIRQAGNISQPFLFQFAQYLKNWADQRIGNVTQGLSEVSNLPGQGQGGKKTAKEIDLISSLQGEVQSLDLQVHQQQMAKVFFQVDALYEQYGSEEEEILITNEKPQKMSRRDIQGKFNIVPNGRLDNTNPILKANKAYNLMKIFMGDPDVEQYELKKLFLMEYDTRAAKTLLISQEDKLKREKQKGQMIEEMKQTAIQQGLDMKKVEIMLDVAKERMMTPITGRKYAPD